MGTWARPRERLLHCRNPLGILVQGLSCCVSEKDGLRGAPGSSAQDGHAGHLLSSVDSGQEARRGLGTFYSPFPDKGIKSHNI